MAMERTEEDVRAALEVAKATLKAASRNLSEAPLDAYEYWFGFFEQASADVRKLQTELMHFEVQRHIRGAS